jgi:hypothetical protein
MKLNVLATAALFGSLLLPVAHAQVIGTIQGNIPFNFSVSNRVLPAGHYSVSALSTRVFKLQNRDHNAITIMFLSSPAQASSEQKTKLVFHRDGDTYFLSQVWRGYGIDGVQLQPSKTERATAERMAAAAKPHKVELASAGRGGGGNPETGPGGSLSTTSEMNSTSAA